MLNRSASLAMSTNVLKALPGKLDIKRHTPNILFISASLAMSISVLKALPGKLAIKRHSPSILYISFYRSSSPIKVGEWHRALIQTVYKDGSLELDKGLPVTDSSQVQNIIHLEQPLSKWYTYLEL